jgi:hypothetical protein
VRDALVTTDLDRDILPFDFKAFKDTKRSSNSGATGDDALCIKHPNGFLYSYFVFEKEEMGNEMNIGLTVEKSSPNIRNYTEHSNESLREFKSTIKDPAFQDLNLIGMSKSALVNRFGEPTRLLGSSLVYKDMSAFHLICHFTLQGQVDWFKYGCIDARISEEELLRYCASYR